MPELFTCRKCGQVHFGCVVWLRMELPQISFRYDINNIISYLIGNIRCLGSLTVGVRDAADFLTGTDLANYVVSSIGNIQIPGSINCNTGGDVEPCTGGSSAIRGVAGDPICLTNYSGDIARSVNLV